jgi:hypothetical protein
MIRFSVGRRLRRRDRDVADTLFQAYCSGRATNGRKIMDSVFKAHLRALACALLIGLSMVAAPAYATRWQDAFPDMTRVGVGELTWFGLHIYRAELWSGSGHFDPARSYVLALTYERKVTAQKQVNVTLDQMDKLGISVARQKRWRPLLEAVMVDVKDGDTMAGAYMPGTGAVFYYNGKRQFASDNTAFINDFFGIWLDGRTTEPGLRRKLLGQAN